MPRRSNRRRASRAARVTAPTAESYRGPIVGRLANQAAAPIEVVISSGFDFTMASGDATYVTFASQKSTPGLVSVTDTAIWDAYATIYDEFRVLGLKVTFAPRMADASVPYVFAKREPAQLPDNTVTMQEAGSFDGFRFLSKTRETTMAIRMSGNPESEWLTTRGSTYPYADHTGIGFGLAGTTSTLYVQVSWRVQYRSAKSTLVTAHSAVIRDARARAAAASAEGGVADLRSSLQSIQAQLDKLAVCGID